MKNKIRRITLLTPKGGSFEVGKEDVVSIVDSSLEFENEIHVQFDIYLDNSRLLTTLINAPVRIDYIR